MSMEALAELSAVQVRIGKVVTGSDVIACILVVLATGKDCV
jgi:hypothetical protein